MYHSLFYSIKSVKLCGFADENFAHVLTLPACYLHQCKLYQIASEGQEVFVGYLCLSEECRNNDNHKNPKRMPNITANSVRRQGMGIMSFISMICLLKSHMGAKAGCW